METTRITIQVHELHIGYAQARAAPLNLPRLHFLAAIVGSCGSGKTTALVRLLNAYLRAHSFDKLVLFSPTLRADPKCQALIKSAERHRVLVDTHESFDDGLFEGVVDKINADIGEEKTERVYAEVYERCVVKGGECSTGDLVLLEQHDYAHSAITAHSLRCTETHIQHNPRPYPPTHPPATPVALWWCQPCIGRQHAAPPGRAGCAAPATSPRYPAGVTHCRVSPGSRDELCNTWTTQHQTSLWNAQKHYVLDTMWTTHLVI